MESAFDGTPLIIVEDDDTLAAICKDLRSEAIIGVDTESDSMHHYQEKVCLIQVSDAHRDYILDPQRLGDLKPFGEVLADRGVVKVFHGADYDIVCLKRDYDFAINNVFDTMIAAQYLGLPRVGLADLCREYFSADMDKKYQTHDWSQRPLLPEHLEYARGDTHYLIALREVLSRKLQRKDRLEIVAEECEILTQREWRGRVPDEEGWQQIKGANQLDDAGKRVLRALWRLRDGEARKMDRPPYKVIPNDLMLRIAQVQPSNLDALSNLARAKSSMFRRYGRGMVDAVREGQNNSEPLVDPTPKKRGAGPKVRYGARETERFFQTLKDWRTRVAARDEVPLVMVASNNHLRALAGWRPRTLEELGEVEDIRAWQIRRYGAEILKLVAEFEGELEPQAPRAPGTARKRKRRRGRAAPSA